MVDRRRLASLARRAIVFVLAYVLASALADRLLPDAAARAQRPAARKGSKKTRVDVDPCANFEFEMMPVNEEAGRGSARDVRIGACNPARSRRPTRRCSTPTTPSINCLGSRSARS